MFLICFRRSRQPKDDKAPRLPKRRQWSLWMTGTTRCGSLRVQLNCHFISFYLGRKKPPVQYVRCEIEGCGTVLAHPRYLQVSPPVATVTSNLFKGTILNLMLHNSNNPMSRVFTGSFRRANTHPQQLGVYVVSPLKELVRSDQLPLVFSFFLCLFISAPYKIPALA